MPEPSGEKILIIDDDPLDRELYKLCLSETADRQFTFAEAASGKDGVARAASFAPDCILLDFNLPDMNGLEVLEKLRDNGSRSLGAPVVMLTGARNERIAVEAMKSGVMDYLPKGQTAAETILYTIDNAIAKFRLQREIEDQQRRYRNLVEAVPHIVWTAKPDGTLDFANSQWLEYFGFPAEAFNLTGWAPLVHSEDAARTEEAWAGGLKSGSAFEIEHRLKKEPGGAFRWHVSRMVPSHGVDGSIVSWTGTSTDVEDQKRAEQAMFNTQKLESLGLLAGGIAHDFNNLLCGIVGGASLVSDALPASHDQQPLLQGILQAGERAGHLTRQMLAYAGKGNLLIEPVDVNELVRNTCDLIAASIPGNVALKIETAAGLPPVEADSGQMQQVIMNLILNAAEAIDEKIQGRVTVRTELRTLDAAAIQSAPLVTGMLVPGTYVAVEVTDNGSGMDSATRARIFDPFFTTKFTGRGLGLSAVGGILRSQNGAMELRTALGAGSTFRVFLHPSAAPKSAHEDFEPASRRRSGGTILVVDDEEMVRRTASRSLENAGFRVKVADGGAEAVRMLQEAREDPFSLILLDLSMPGMSGKEAMRQIRNLGVKEPVLICSGYSENEIYRQFSGIDIAGAVQKPFTARQLAERVTRLLYPEQNRR